MKALRNKLIYLASPYTHPCKIVKEKRFLEITRLASEIIKKGYLPLTPITASHEIARIGNLQGCWPTWRKLDLQMVKRSDAVVVAQMDGWRESIGVTAEIRAAKRYGKPVYYLNPNSLEITERP